MTLHSSLKEEALQRPIPGEGEAAFEAGVVPRPLIPADHPYRLALLDDPNLFWTWHPSTWSRRDRAARERATGADILGLFDEIAELRERLAELAQRAADPGTVDGRRWSR